MKKLVEIYYSIENVILCFLLGVLILLSFLQVAGRLFFNVGLPDADPVIYHLVMWLGLVGAVLASREKEHITIDIVSKFVRGRFLNLIQVLTGLFTSGVCILLTWIAIRFIQDEIQYNSVEIIGLPLWIFQIIIPIAFGLMSIRFLLATLNSSLQVFKPDVEKGDNP